MPAIFCSVRFAALCRWSAAGPARTSATRSPPAVLFLEEPRERLLRRQVTRRKLQALVVTGNRVVLFFQPFFQHLGRLVETRRPSASGRRWRRLRRRTSRAARASSHAAVVELAQRRERRGVPGNFLQNRVVAGDRVVVALELFFIQRGEPQVDAINSLSSFGVVVTHACSTSASSSWRAGLRRCGPARTRISGSAGLTRRAASSAASASSGRSRRS